MVKHKGWRLQLAGVAIFLSIWQLFAIVSDTRMFPGLEAIAKQFVEGA